MVYFDGVFSINVPKGSWRYGFFGEFMVLMGSEHGDNCAIRKSTLSGGIF
ncbi:unnamed protein product [Acidithrix sp. C25]|nr:unnamed protein product [Acidithrix sp. C25]